MIFCKGFITSFYNSKSKNGFVNQLLETFQSINTTALIIIQTIMDFSESRKFQEMFDDINTIKKNTRNKDSQQIFIGHIADIMEYSVTRNDKMFSQQLLNFIVDIFMIIGELDYDDVEPVLDALTASRIVLKNLIK
jgi:cell division protein ZapA (FtsZ GTPase activity inhibitor)